MRWKGVASHLEPAPPPSPVVSSDVFWEVVFFNLLFFLFCSLWSDCHCGASTVNFHLISGWWKWGRCVLNWARLQQLWSAVALMKFYQQSQREPRRPAAIQSPHGGHKRLRRVCVWKHLLNYSCSHQVLSALRLVWTLLKSVLGTFSGKTLSCQTSNPSESSASTFSRVSFTDF